MPPDKSSLLPSAGGRHDGVHSQILDHLPISVVRVLAPKHRQPQTARFAPPRRLEHVLSRQRGRGSVTESEGILQELENLHLRLNAVGTGSADIVLWDVVTSKPQPQG